MTPMARTFSSCRMRRHPRLAAGFSLIELMVALTVTVFMILAVTALFTNNSMARKEIDSAGQQIENGRYAMELLRDDVRLAGYYGEFVAPFTGVSWQLPANPCDPTLANLGWNSDGTLVPVGISGFEGHDAAIAALSPQCIANRVAGSDVLVVRRVGTNALAAPAAAGTPYLQVSLQSTLCTSSEAAFAFDVIRSPNPFALHKRDCASAAVVRPYVVHIYYVASCDDCAAADGIPTLKRVELAGNRMTEPVSLAQGIADMRVDYGMDTNNDGFPDEYKKCGADATHTGPCTAADWANAMAVKVYLLTRNLENTPGYDDAKTYSMGLAGTLPALGATERKFKHHVYSSPIRLVSMSNVRETP
jgi:type IV pilus assembly protein PilW